MNTAINRINYIDALRGVAILLSLEQHLGVWFWRANRAALSEHPILIGINTIGGFAGPIFMTLAGIGAYFLSQQRANADLTLVLRGAIVLVYGYILNVMTPCWFSYGSWFILHMIGFGILMSPLFRRMPLSGIFVAMVICLAVTYAGQNFLDTPSRMSNHRMGNLNLPYGVFQLILFEGHFPIFPCLCFFMGGSVVGKLIYEEKDTQLKIITVSFFAVSASIAICYFSKLPFATQGPLARFFKATVGLYPATSLYVLGLFPLVILSLFIFRAIDARIAFTSKHPLVCLGRSSLTIFMVHIVVFKELGIRFGYFQKLPITKASLAVLAVMLMFTVLAVIWQRYNYRYGTEWLLRKIAR